MASPVDPKKHECNICKGRFTTKRGQKDHRKAMHASVEGSTACRPPPQALQWQQKSLAKGKEKVEAARHGGPSKVNGLSPSAGPSQQLPKGKNTVQHAHQGVSLSQVHRTSSTINSSQHTTNAKGKAQPTQHGESSRQVNDTSSTINTPQQVAKAKNKAQSTQHNGSSHFAYRLLPNVETIQRVYLQYTPELVVTETLDVPAPLSHRNNAYTTVSTAQEQGILDKLSELCQPESRLSQEGYQLSEGTTSAKGKNAVSGLLRHLPEPLPSQPKFRAVVVDCEMGRTASGHNELIRLAVIEFLSGRVLVDRLVRPSTPIADWRTDITGIDGVSMQDAIDRNKTLAGWEAARDVLRAIADRNTIIVGQSALFDLYVLRTAHNRIVDSAIVTADAVLRKKALKMKKRWPLQDLCQELLGIQIRKPSPLSVAPHSALEDALATRELAIFFVQHPERLRVWSRKARKDFYTPNAQRHGGSQGQKKGKGSMRQQYGSDNNMEFSDGESPLRWEDVIDWEMWPKSPPSSCD
ncbi:exonuclease domain-containing protein [Sarocladium implicatum]|nr:exonuclease domain-containing protein [Sarocladium implicatum]